MRMYIGLDVHSKFTVYCAQDEQGTVLSEGKVFTSADGLGELIRTVEAPVETRIALESGGQATWVSRLLTQMGMCPVVINAYEVRAKARKGDGGRC